LGISVAKGRFLLPVDSDFILMDGALQRILQEVENEHHYRILFFPCLHYATRSRLDKLGGSCEITYERFLGEDLGELIPVVDLQYLKHRDIGYPKLKSGGESLLWAQILAQGPARFIDNPVVLYRTDATNRICTL